MVPSITKILCHEYLVLKSKKQNKKEFILSYFHSSTKRKIYIINIKNSFVINNITIKRKIYSKFKKLLLNIKL